MIRVYVIVEGQTEESFVRAVLSPAFWPLEIYLFPTLLGVPGHKGGRPNYARVKKDVVLQLKQDRNAFCSTMLDFYGLGGGFPGTPLPPNLGHVDKVVRIEQAVKEQLINEFPDLRPDRRFLPYLQLHEYEGLLFSDPATFADGIKQHHLRADFEAIRNAFGTPEDINDNPNTAPSRRVRGIYPPYRKVIDGTLAAKAVGIDRMRQECPHFRAWLEQLESLAG